MKIRDNVVEIDRLIDYIPFVSTLNSLSNIFIKTIVIPHLQKTNPNYLKNHYFCYINQKDLSRCAILLIPFIGNLVVFTQDFFTELLYQVEVAYKTIDFLSSGAISASASGPISSIEDVD